MVCGCVLCKDPGKFEKEMSNLDIAPAVSGEDYVYDDEHLVKICFGDTLQDNVQQPEDFRQNILFFPDFIKNQELYSAVIRETNTGEKFMDLILQIASEPLITGESLFNLVKLIERDLKLVHNAEVFQDFLPVVESMNDFLMKTGLLVKS